jgi:hypothetical protein
VVTALEVLQEEMVDQEAELTKIQMVLETHLQYLHHKEIQEQVAVLHTLLQVEAVVVLVLVQYNRMDQEVHQEVEHLTHHKVVMVEMVLL